MAGSYPDVPSRRMAWDADGSVGLWLQTDPYDPTTNMSSAHMIELNDEDNTLVNAPAGQIQGNMACIIFPELREIDGFYVNHWRLGESYFRVHSSGDTTNGIDGTWNTLQSGALAQTVGEVYSEYRTDIQSEAENNRRGIRMGGFELGSSDDERFWAFHVYGEISAGQTPDRLLYVDATSGVEFSLPIDYGDVPRGSAEDRTFKLKNNSGSLTASSVQVTAEALYLSSGNWYTFSEGGAYQSTLALASSIGSGASSPTITCRRDIPDTEQVGLHAARIKATYTI